MSGTELCRCCKQPLPPQLREGVHLPAKKAAIFDTIMKHPGITAEGILANCFDEKTPVATVRVHVCQINDMLAPTSVRICGERRGGWKEKGGYRIVKVRVPA